jgi:hypothetical protein
MTAPVALRVTIQLPQNLSSPGTVFIVSPSVCVRIRLDHIGDITEMIRLQTSW